MFSSWQLRGLSTEVQTLDMCRILLDLPQTGDADGDFDDDYKVGNEDGNEDEDEDDVDDDDDDDFAGLGHFMG